jgi:hypothetical protein
VAVAIVGRAADDSGDDEEREKGDQRTVHRVWSW